MPSSGSPEPGGDAAPQSRAGSPAAPRPQIRLADLTTLRLGGPAKTYVEVSTEADLVEVVADADRRGEPLLLLGQGSNLVVGDDGFDGTVVAVRTRGVEPLDIDACAGASVQVAAGESWDALVERAVGEEWSGIECLSGIPGLVGATPIQNVGAYGQEVASTVAQVRTWDRSDGAVRTLAAADCRFGYRTSRFKLEPDRFVVLSVTFQLPTGSMSAPVRYADLADELGVAPGTRVPLSDARSAVQAVRARKGMLLDAADHDTWSAGSFFTNPVLDPTAFEALRARATERLGPAVEPPAYPGSDGNVKTSAAWLIERSGFARGYGNDRVRLSTKHTLALTNRGGARTSDLLELAAEVTDGVASMFGVQLVREPVLVGVS